uniref:Uncharacterized protein n=1 Tax=Candidatus Kentrum sp. MB TaxID=2138164 RepID=A0A450X2Q8_9GAMM|nr:MAG: hypothetical protein BECKMB1821G_GA0114241_100526 [Candidatus Kentron sp. MB]
MLWLPTPRIMKKRLLFHSNTNENKYFQGATIHMVWGFSIFYENYGQKSNTMPYDNLLISRLLFANKSKVFEH